MPQVDCYSSLDKSVIHLRFFDGYFISPKYILREKINSKKFDPLISAKRSAVRGGACRLRSGDENSAWAALQGALEQISHPSLGVLQTEIQVHFGVQR